MNPENNIHDFAAAARRLSSQPETSQPPVRLADDWKDVFDKQDSSENDKQPNFRRRRATVAGAAIAAAIIIPSGIGLGQYLQRESAADALESQQNQHAAAIEAYEHSIDQELTRLHDSKDLVAKITITEGGTIIDSAEQALESSLGDKYVRADYYDTLLHSADNFTPHDGSAYDIVATQNIKGHEGETQYVVVDTNKVNYGSIAAIPAVQIDSAPQDRE